MNLHLTRYRGKSPFTKPDFFGVFATFFTDCLHKRVVEMATLHVDKVYFLNDVASFFQVHSGVVEQVPFGARMTKLVFVVFIWLHGRIAVSRLYRAHP